MKKPLLYTLITAIIVLIITLNYIFFSNLQNLEISLERILSIMSTLVLTGALIMSIRGFQKSNNISKSTFLLELREKFGTERRHKVHKTLKSGEIVEDWVDLDDYLRLFEVCEMMIKNRTIEFQDFEKLYKYRLGNILHDKKVVFCKLVEEADSWDDLYGLLNRCFPDCQQEFNDLKNLKSKDVKISDKEFSDIMDRVHQKLSLTTR
ncbi:MAG: hypothetical protein FWC94_01520 [Bacteroidales bacterium]|nr:hypothetical protein [Bacteroidales bacterium]